MVAVGYVVVHHFVMGTLMPGTVFDRQGSPLAMATIHAVFVLIESLVLLTAWRVLDDRRERVERLVRERTAELRGQRNLLSRLAAVVESTDDAVIVTCPKGAIVTWNPGAELLYGFASAEAIGRPLELVTPEEGVAELRRALGALDEGRSVRLENVNVRRDGSRFEALATISNVYDERRRRTGIVAITRDITERKRSETEAIAATCKLEEQATQLTRQALHDALTGLANRVLLDDRLQRALARRGHQRTGLLLLDLDNSSRSTTSTATRRAIMSSSRSRDGSSGACAQRTPSPDSAATSSSCCWRTSPGTTERAWCPTGSSPRCRPRSRCVASRSRSRRALGSR